MFRLIVIKKNEDPSIYEFEYYDDMEYNASLLEFSSNPNLLQVVAQERDILVWRTLFRINYK